MRKISIFISAIVVALLPLQIPQALAAGISASGGGSKVVGQNFTIAVVASGAEFDSLQGTISVSGPVSIVSFGAGSATWLPGKSPSNGNQFVGIASPTKSLTVASVTLKGTKEGKGSVTVSGVKLARNGAYVGDGGGSASFTIGRAPTPPGGVSISSPTHPDQSTAYEATGIEFKWSSPNNGATGYSYLFNELAETAPEPKVNTTATSVTIDSVTIGTHYFHIRAQNRDGWGPVAHYKIIIKEPDAKIDASLAAPTISGIEKTSAFKTDLAAGTVQGFVVKGSGGLSGYIINLSLDPKDRLPTELFQPVAPKSDAPGTAAEISPVASPAPTVSKTPLMAEPDATGNWSVTIDYPIPAAYYKLTAQGQKDKVLTKTASAGLELSLALGGNARLITDADKTPPVDRQVEVLGVKFSTQTHLWLAVLFLILLVAFSHLGVLLFKQRFRHPLPGKYSTTEKTNLPLNTRR